MSATVSFSSLAIGASFYFAHALSVLHTKVGGSSFVSSANGMTFKTHPAVTVVLAS